MSTKLNIDNTLVENWVSKNVKNRPAFVQDLELFLNNLSTKYQSAYQKSSKKSIHDELMEEMASNDIDDKADIIEKKRAQNQFVGVVDSSLKNSSSDVKNLFSYLKKEASNLTRYSSYGKNNFQDSFPDYDDIQNEDKQNTKTAINIMRTYSENNINEFKEVSKPRVNFDLAKNTVNEIERRGEYRAKESKPRLSFNNNSDQENSKLKAYKSEIKLPKITRG